MLNQNQRRRLEASSRWLREILSSAEFKQLEYYPDVTLGDAIQAIGELLDEHDPCDYNRANFNESAKTRRFGGVTVGVNQKVSVSRKS
jgi:hypothetical protein